VTRELAHLSDEALVALTARAEQSALAELYDRYGRPAYGLALRVLRDESLAEDAVQDAFMAIWRTAPRFVPEKGKASTWILTLVHRRSVDVVRREQRRRTDSIDVTHEPRTQGADERRGCACNASASNTHSASCQTSSARRSSSRTTAASRRPNWRSGSASRSARSRAGCSWGWRGCASSSATR
jgi:RNA polymerase sigma factor (sigma-70 family)